MCAFEEEINLKKTQKNHVIKVLLPEYQVYKFFYYTEQLCN